MDRRTFLGMTAAGAVTLGITASPLRGLAQVATGSDRIRAVLFDAFPIFDPRPIFATVRQFFPDHADALGKAWFAKIFSYTWLRTLGEHYVPFERVIEEALAFVIKDSGLTMTEDARRELLAVWTRLPLWPDVAPALAQCREKGVRLGFLSNMSEAMQRANARHNGVEDMFEFYLSTDRVQAYKPAVKAYDMGPAAFGYPKGQIAFAAFAGWDAHGASWYGYPTVWVNRLGASAETLDGAPVIAGKDMDNLVRFILP
ncbi:MAG: haloacid dehalogenase type II [Alphaproteobacteria bacterium]|nr:haloacid dehalogenase type II [Alphaproteobacteria bacterium]MBU0858826.1 haloacid dehalogenase type II [Alphaproteobacteria bacterium]